MSTATKKSSSTLLIVLAFAIVYLVWGSTYFFIGKAVQEIPPFIMGAVRFIIAGAFMLAWCIIKKEKLWDWQQVKPAAISGLLLLLVGNGGVIWAEKTLPSSLVAIIISSAPLWFVLLDKPKWKENFTNRNTLVGLFVGFIGVLLLFGEQASKTLGTPGKSAEVITLLVVIIGCMSWAGGSLYSKYKATGSATVNTTWQMLAAGAAFLLISFMTNEWGSFNAGAVSTGAWLSLVYLILMGSLVAYSAYVWLLKTVSATQVSTYAYVNPVVAVLLGVFFASEQISWMQIVGLAIILGSVLLINLAKYRKEKAIAKNPDKPAVNPSNSQRGGTTKMIVPATGATK